MEARILRALVVASTMSPGKNSLCDKDGESIKRKLTETFDRGEKVIIIRQSDLMDPFVLDGIKGRALIEAFREEE